MNEQSYEKEINLRGMLYRVLREWRKCVIIALVGGLVVGAGNFALKMIQLVDPEKLEEAKLNYERELAAYEREGENLQTALENLEEKLEQQEEYNEASILMQINPFSEYIMSVQLYVSTNYQILPELTYQNVDLSSRILRSYATYMENGEMYQYILNHLREKIELRYLQEILSISSDYSSYMVTLRIRGVDEQACQEIMDYALEGIYSKQGEILTTVGEHELNLVNQTAYETVNLDLDARQKSNRQYVLDLNDNIDEVIEDLEDWALTPKPKETYTLWGVMKDSIKKIILGCIVVGLLVAMCIAFGYIISDKVQDAEGLREYFGLRVIARIPKVHEKRAWEWVDRMFAKAGGLVLRESEEKRLTKVAVHSIGAELAARLESEKPEAEDARRKKLIFTGSIEAEEIKSFLADTKWEKEFSVSGVPSILQNPAAILAMTEADYVVLVEKQEESRYSQIKRELEMLAAWKKEVLGVIVLGVDGIPS